MAARCPLGLDEPAPRAPVVDLYCEDACAWGGSRRPWARDVALILTDPPYPSLDRHRRAGGPTVRLAAFFGTESYRNLLGVLEREARRLMTGHFAVVMSDATSAYELARIDRVEIPEAGTDAPVGAITGLRWRTPWIWVKTGKAMDHPVGGMGYYGRGAYEMVLVLQAPGKTPADIAARLHSRPNVLMGPRANAPVWPTQKPGWLADELIGAFGGWGRLVDPFAGSGWAGESAAAAGMDAELVDIASDAPCLRRENYAGAMIRRHF